MLKDQIRRIFTYAWQRYGRPQLLVVGPPSTWQTYLYYDERLDVLRTAEGGIVTEPFAYWTTTSVYMLPVAVRRTRTELAEMKELLAAGTITTGITEVIVLRSDLEKLRQAHTIIYNDQPYKLDGIQEGAGEWARVRLRGR